MNQKEISIALQLHKECQVAVEATLKELPLCSYQDATNAWLLNKLAAIMVILDDVERIPKPIKWAKSKPLK